LKFHTIQYNWEILKFDKKEVIDDRIKMELLQFPFLEREDINPLDFLLILDYYRLIADTWEIFEKIFRSKSELKDHFHRINSLRNAVKHSRPVQITTLKMGEASMEWFILILEKTS